MSKTCIFSLENYCILLFPTLFFLPSGMESIEDMERLHQYLTRISWELKPRYNQSERVVLDIALNLNTITDYNEVSGTLSFSGSYIFFWNDEIKKWNPTNYGGIFATKLPILKTWIPMIAIRNGVGGSSFYKLNDLDVQKSTVVYNSVGDAFLIISGLYDVTCTSDVTYYLFDKHTCSILILSSDLLNDITLSPLSTMNFGSYMPNSEWSIDATTTKTVKQNVTFELLGSRSYQDQIELSIVISREYLFPVLNIVLPVVCLGFVHLLVFLLPVESGERTSFSFTLLLTLIVFMTMVSDRLPSSNDISIFNMYLLHQLLCSMCITSLAVFSIHLFYKDIHDTNYGFVCRVLLLLYRVSRNMCTRKTNHYNPNGKDVDENKCLWRLVSLFFDKLCFWCLFVAFVLQIIIYGLIIVSKNH